MATRRTDSTNYNDRYREQAFWNDITYDYEMTEAVIPDGITEIPEFAFRGRDQLTSVHIPDSVTTIWRGAFMGCESLKEIHIPDSVKSIGESQWEGYWHSGTFSGCRSLTEITIPEGVESIRRGTFAACTSLRSVSLPDSITSIDEKAFLNCKELTSIRIPEGVTYIGEGAFAGCRKLTSVSIPESIKRIDTYAFADTPWLEHHSDDWLIVGSVLLRYRGREQEVVIPDTITSISAEAFAGCTELTSITSPDSVNDIGMGAFRNCRKLKSITIPDSVTGLGYADSAGYYTLEGCSGLTSVTVRNITLNKAALDHFRKQDGNDPLSEAIVLIANHYRDHVFGEQPEFLADVVWTVFGLYPDDEETLAYIKENFHKLFPFLLNTDNADLLQKVMDDRAFIKRRNIDKYIAHTIDKKLPRMQKMLETYKAEHLGRRKKRRSDSV